MCEAVGRSAPVSLPVPLSLAGERFSLAMVGDKMNRLHRWYCQSNHWRHRLGTEILPWSLKGVDLCGEVLELGPGPGLTTDWLRPQCRHLTCLELDPTLACSLRERTAGIRTSRCRSATPRQCHSTTGRFPLFSHLRCSTIYLHPLCKTGCFAKHSEFSSRVASSPARIACGPCGCRYSTSPTRWLLSIQGDCRGGWKRLASKM